MILPPAAEPVSLLDSLHPWLSALRCSVPLPGSRANPARPARRSLDDYEHAGDSIWVFIFLSVLAC